LQGPFLADHQLFTCGILRSHQVLIFRFTSLGCSYVWLGDGLEPPWLSSLFWV